MSQFTATEWQRSQRHIQLKEIGVEGQIKLKQARVVIVGLGGLGCPAAQYLASAGVGRLTLVDGDRIAASNLQRQILYSHSQIGQYKVEAAREQLQKNNPNVQIEVVKQHLMCDNAKALLADASLALDCTDNFQSRYLINYYCLKLSKAWVYASVIRLDGQIALFTPGNACYACLFPQAAQQLEDCNSAGVLASLPGILGCLQATEALKYLCGIKQGLVNSLLLVDGMGCQFRRIQLQKNPECGCNSKTPPLHLSTESCNTEEPNHSISSQEFNSLKNSGKWQLLDVRSHQEHQAFNIGGFNLPLEELYADLALNPQGKYLIYCQTGFRSQKAVEYLQQQNFHNLHSLKGGVSAWLESQ